MNYISDAAAIMSRIAFKIVVERDGDLGKLCSGNDPGHSGKASGQDPGAHLPFTVEDANSGRPSVMNRSPTTSLEEASTESDVESEYETNLVTKSLDLLLEFQSLTYMVQHNSADCGGCHRKRGNSSPHTLATKDVEILHNISGKVKAGEIMAVVGPSGSGKSTLIDALAQRIAPDKLRGNITLNGEDVKCSGIIRSISAYVMQDDLLFPMLTVKETLRFAAELRLPKSFSEKASRVDEVLTQLNLTKVADTIIGNEEHRGVSGGERKRVSIGKEIIHDPLLLFLDEPTSGLDSTNALIVISTLQSIAKTGSLIMLSVHQPSERILKLITTLLFIADGHIIYRGKPAGIRDYFEVYHGFSIPEGTSTIEYGLDLVQGYTMKTSAGIAPLVQSFKSYSEQNKYQEIATAADSMRAASLTADPESLLSTYVRDALPASTARGRLVGGTEYLKRYNDNDELKAFANSRMYEVYVLAWRGLMNTRRTPALLVMRLGAVTLAGLILATLFWKLDYSPEGLRERLGFYAFATSTTFYVCADTLPIFLQERHIFMRETAHGSYRISSYILASALINIPFLLLLTFAFSITTFWTVGLSGGAAGYFFFSAVIWASFWAGNSFATLLSGMVSNVITGYTIVVAALAYFLLLSGFFITRNRISPYWLWFHYLSVIKYPYEAVLLNEFGRSGSACYETGEQILSDTPFGGSEVVADYVLSQLRVVLQNTQYRDLNGSACMMDGAAVLRSQDIGELSKWVCLGITVSFGVFYRLLFYAILRGYAKKKRR